MILEEFVSVLGLEIESDDLPKFQSGLQGTIGKMAGVAAAAVAGAASISALLESVGDTAATSKFARSIDVSFGSLQRLEVAAEQATGSAGAIRGVLQGLDVAARGAANGLDSGAAVAFGRLGVSIRDANGEMKSADQLLLGVADAVKRARNPDLALSVAEQLGLGPDLNLLLRLGSDGINDLGDEAERLGLIMGDKAAKESERFTEGMNRLKRAGQRLLIDVGLPLVEWLNTTVQWFERFRKSETASKALEFLGQAADFAMARLRLLLEPFKILMALWEEFGPAIKNAFAPIMPVLDPIIDAVKRLYSILMTLADPLALLNDARVFFQGGDSLIGAKLAERGISGDAVRDFASRGVRSAIDGVGSFVSDPLGSISGIFGAGPPSAALAGGGGGAVTQENVFNITGAGDPEAVARRVAQLTDDSLREATKNVASPFVK